MLRRVRTPALAITVGWLLSAGAIAVPGNLGCGSAGDDAPATAVGATDADASGSSEPALTPVASAAAATPAARPPHERPLPAFSGVTLDDRTLAVGDLLGKRFVLFLFNPEVDVAAAAARGMAAVSALRGKNNFEILGVATGGRRAASQAFVAEHGLDFPVLDDSASRVAQMLRAPVPVLLASVDGEGYVTWTTGWPEGSEIDAAAVEASVREMLRLPAAPTPTHPVLGERPPAPEVAGTDLEGKSFRLSALRGQPVLVVFFLHTCPHCHHSLAFLKEQLPKIPEERRPKLVGVSVVDRAYAVRERMKADGLDFFPILMDPDGSLRAAYGATAGVPDLALVDREGRIVRRSNGWEDERDPPLWRMWLAKVAGEPIPMLLHKTGYSGDEFCAPCHELETQTHAFTQHAYAFDTLVRHGAERNAECVSCHVVGFGQPGGWSFGHASQHLEGVGCESCHARGGPHLSPGLVKDGNYASACLVCHDKKHSLGFDYATFRPRISHTGNADVLGLALDAKLARIEALGAPRKALMPGDAAFVGSDACQSCHPDESATWAASGHARAGATLAAKGQAGSADCLACHTTGFGQEGGFPKSASLADHTDLGRVGCESCHGAGGDHVAEGAARIGTILSLGDKCDSCVILQICGSCHDDANDPGFEFEVQEKIDRQRHGTIEPGTGKKKGAASAALHVPHTTVPDLPLNAVLGALERALAARPPG